MNLRSHYVDMAERVIHDNLFYPRNDNQPDTFQIGLIDVRAADDIRIKYDFDRDGWAISQASRFSWEPGEEPEEDWQEVAFIPAWGRQQPGPGDEEYVWKDDR